MTRTRPFRAAVLATVAALGLVMPTGIAHSSRSGAPHATAGQRPTLFVHGYQENARLDCVDTWARAREYFQQRGHAPESLHTVGFYRNDTRCADQIASATVDTPITEIAARLARHVHEQYVAHGQRVDILAHSMGGIIARVAVLGAAQGWDGFPHEKLPVANVVTLAAPHQGVRDPDLFHNTQWDSLHAGSDFLRKLHAPQNRLDREWSANTQWTLAGSDADNSVSGNSALDQGFPAEHKYRYLRDGGVTHVSMIEALPDAGPFPLRFWHAADGVPHETQHGGAPLEEVHHALERT